MAPPWKSSLDPNKVLLEASWGGEVYHMDRALRHGAQIDTTLVVRARGCWSGGGSARARNPAKSARAHARTR
jgi:hypothetical protein